MNDASSTIPTFATPPTDYGYAIIFVVSVCTILLFGFVAFIVWSNRKWKREQSEANLREKERDTERAEEKKIHAAMLEKLDQRREDELRQRREDDERRRKEDKADHERRYRQEIDQRDKFRELLKGEIRGQFLELAGLTHTSFDEITAQAKANRDAYTHLDRLVDGLGKRIEALEKIQNQQK